MGDKSGGGGGGDTGFGGGGQKGGRGPDGGGDRGFSGDGGGGGQKGGGGGGGDPGAGGGGGGDPGAGGGGGGDPGAGGGGGPADTGAPGGDAQQGADLTARDLAAQYGTDDLGQLQAGAGSADPAPDAAAPVDTVRASGAPGAAPSAGGGYGDPLAAGDPSSALTLSRGDILDTQDPGVGNVPPTDGASAGSMLDPENAAQAAYSERAAEILGPRGDYGPGTQLPSADYGATPGPAMAPGTEQADTLAGQQFAELGQSDVPLDTQVAAAEGATPPASVTTPITATSGYFPPGTVGAALNAVPLPVRDPRYMQDPQSDYLAPTRYNMALDLPVSRVDPLGRAVISEVGTSNPAATQANLEETFNRAQSYLSGNRPFPGSDDVTAGKALSYALSDPTQAKDTRIAAESGGPLSAAQNAGLTGPTENVLAGSNLIKGATGNYMGTDPGNFNAGYQTYSANVPGQRLPETFGVEGPDRPFAQMLSNANPQADPRLSAGYAAYGGGGSSSGADAAGPLSESDLAGQYGVTDFQQLQQGGGAPSVTPGLGTLDLPAFNAPMRGAPIGDIGPDLTQSSDSSKIGGGGAGTFADGNLLDLPAFNAPMRGAPIGDFGPDLTQSSDSSAVEGGGAATPGLKNFGGGGVPNLPSPKVDYQAGAQLAGEMADVGVPELPPYAPQEPLNPPSTEPPPTAPTAPTAPAPTTPDTSTTPAPTTPEAPAAPAPQVAGGGSVAGAPGAPGIGSSPGQIGGAVGGQGLPPPPQVVSAMVANAPPAVQQAASSLTPAQQTQVTQYAFGLINQYRQMLLNQGGVADPSSPVWQQQILPQIQQQTQQYVLQLTGRANPQAVQSIIASAA